MEKHWVLVDRYHFLSFGLIVVKAIQSLQDSVIYERVHARLRHLIVDEYQDVNPAQEKLVELLGASPVQVCIVGDDDQSIYQWRGSDVSNILTFAKRRPNVKVIKLESNRRSRPEIVTIANAFALTIPQRLDKLMQANRPAGSPEIVRATRSFMSGIMHILKQRSIKTNPIQPIWLCPPHNLVP